jgi:hypothetical protein
VGEELNDGTDRKLLVTMAATNEGGKGNGNLIEVKAARMPCVSQSSYHRGSALPRSHVGLDLQ